MFLPQDRQVLFHILLPLELRKPEHNLFHDGGFSSMGMSLRAMSTYEKGLEEFMDENGNIIYG